MPVVSSTTRLQLIRSAEAESSARWGVMVPAARGLGGEDGIPSLPPPGGWASGGIAGATPSKGGSPPEADPCHRGPTMRGRSAVEEHRPAACPLRGHGPRPAMA